MEEIKKQLAEKLAKHRAGFNQVVELPVGLIRAILTDKPAGAVAEQDVLSSSVIGLKPTDKVFQSADSWLSILGEL